MAHLPHFITDLALILAVAAVTTLLCKKLNQPVVLGYIIAGFLVGPHVSLIPTVVDSESVRTWSEMGVIFLLFSLGLEFSFKKLLKVGGSAAVTAIIGIIVMFILGVLLGTFMNWNKMDRIFLGAIVSISSTTIIVRAFDELGVRTSKFASVVFGVLIIQDLVAVLMMVLLSTFAVSQQFSGLELLKQLMKLVFFLTLWFVSGIFFIPTFLKRTKKFLNDETLLIVSISLCLAMVLLATEVGFSAALGAFIMGSILAETTQGEHIESLVKSVKNLFAAIFFVSVGVMIDPITLQQFSVPIVAVTLIVLIGMPLATATGAMLGGQPLKQSIQTGLSLSQIGEFSFIIASLGVSLNVTSDFLYPISVAASAITTFTTPFFIKASTSVYSFLDRKLPTNWTQALNRYSAGSQQLSGYSEWQKLLRAYAVNAIIHIVIIGAIIYFSHRIFQPLFVELIANELTATIAAIIITMLLMVPFIWALAIRRVDKESYSSLWLNKKLNRGPLIAIELVRIAIAVVLVAIFIHLYFSLIIALITAVSSMIISTFVFNKKLQAFYDRLENRFLLNYNEKERQRIFKNEIAPWDAHLSVFEVLPGFRFAGLQLQELKLREDFGVNIALIERGKLSIVTPSRHERLYPGDKLSIIGTDDQLTRIRDIFETAGQESEQQIHEEEISLQNFVVTRESPLYKESIRNSGIREKANALVVGLERNGQRILNPESTVQLLEGDTVWVVGIKDNIDNYLKGKSQSLKQP